MAAAHHPLGKRSAGEHKTRPESAAALVQSSGCELIRAASERQRPITTKELFGSQREILLSHDGTLYRLRITSNDKLILTK